jgi:CheY-like chemotaxis protein
MERRTRVPEEKDLPLEELGKTILIVEDDDITRELLGLLLQRVGYRVAQAADGRQALDLLEEGRKPDLILLDMMMPRLDGWGFLEKKSASPALAPIPVVISTAVSDASPNWAAALGARGFVNKPFDVSTLLEEVEHCCA